MPENICLLPTPLQRLSRLERMLGGPGIYVKRDDLTGLATGGNKARKLAFLVLDAIRQGATTLVTAGPLQSNHCRQTAAAAAMSGLGCDLLLSRVGAWDDPEYETNGNALLNTLLAPRTHLLEYLDLPERPNDPTAAYGALGLEIIAERVRARGEIPYIIPIGGSNPIGALGYAHAIEELMVQATAAGITVDHIFHASGSGGTAAGLLAGLQIAQAKTTLNAVDILGMGQGMRSNILGLAEATLASLRGSEARSSDEASDLASRLHLLTQHSGGGYARPTPEMMQATRLLAQTEGLILDPIYTGKTMAALLAEVASGRIASGDNVIFIHTGGTSCIFARPSLYTSRTSLDA